MSGALLVADLGTMPFVEALDLQRAVARARISGLLGDDVLLLVEHPPVVTQGRSSKAQHLLASPALLAARGVDLHEVERGGDVTFHGPGQLVGYPIIDLKRHKQDLHWYLRTLEEALIGALATFEISGERRAGLTGVWTEGRKIASIGVHARDWVTWHGFALNVSTDLTFFDLIVPCGIAAVKMTSIAAELDGKRLPYLGTEGLGRATRSAVSSATATVFGLDVRAVDLAELERVAAPIVPV